MEIVTFLDSSAHYVLIVFNALLLTYGLWKFFPKCGVNKKTAFIPFYRLYKLAQAADVEDAGIILSISTLLLYSFPLLYEVFVDLFTAGESTEFTLILAAGILVALQTAILIYRFRIYWALCETFKKSKLWVILWLGFNGLTCIIWGCSAKVEPAYDPFSTREAAPDSGVEAETIGDGLTVNIESRSTIERLRKKVLLRDIHLNIKPGRMVLLLGGSGAGKTTLVNAIIGYEKAKAKILLNGEDVYKNYNKLKYNIGLVPQQDLIRYDDTVLRTLTDAAILRLPENVTSKQLNQRVQEVLNIFGLASQTHQEVEKMSGGQKKRLSIAMEYICDPYLFVLDEPDSGLDGVLARDLMTRLRAISREGKIVLVITHSPDRVIDLFDDVIVLAKDANKTGRLVYYGPVDEAKTFFGVDTMEEVVKQVNRVDEGGAGRADELIEKFMEVSNGTN